MNFGEPSPRSVDAANGFMVERVKKTPPRWNRVNCILSVDIFAVYRMNPRFEIVI